MTRIRATSTVLAALLAGAFLVATPTAAVAASGTYTPISGEVSAWASPVWSTFEADSGHSAMGGLISDSPVPSSSARQDFADDTSRAAQFAGTETPYDSGAADPADSLSPSFGYEMIPIAAGGIAFAYNLPIGFGYGALKLSPAAIAGIFTGRITKWDDPQIQTTNPAVTLPDRAITAVVPSEGESSSEEMTSWLLQRYPADYRYLASQTGGPSNAPTSYFLGGDEKVGTLVAASGYSGIEAAVENTPYSIDFAPPTAPFLQYTVASVENAAGFFTQPTPQAVSIALQAVTLNSDAGSADYLSQEQAPHWSDRDPRAYPFSTYTYELAPTQTTSGFDSADGATLGWFTANAVCTWQSGLPDAGYAPLPMEVTQAAEAEVLKIPGIDSATEALATTVRRDSATGSGDPCPGDPAYQPGQSASMDSYTYETLFPQNCYTPCQASSAYLQTGPLSAPLPTIAGTAKVGDRVAARSGNWTHGTTLRYQWSAAGHPIAKATSSVLTLTPALLNKSIAVRVTGTAGNITAFAASYGTVVAPGSLTAHVPTITGTPRIGKALAAHPGSWTRGTKLAYQWYADGVAIGGATHSTFRPSRPQLGASIAVSVTGSLAGYSRAEEVSRSTKSVTTASGHSVGAPHSSSSARPARRTTVPPTPPIPRAVFDNAAGRPMAEVGSGSCVNALAIEGGGVQTWHTVDLSPCPLGQESDWVVYETAAATATQQSSQEALQAALQQLCFNPYHVARPTPEHFLTPSSKAKSGQVALSRVIEWSYDSVERSASSPILTGLLAGTELVCLGAPAGVAQ